MICRDESLHLPQLFQMSVRCNGDFGFNILKNIDFGFILESGEDSCLEIQRFRKELPKHSVCLKIL